MLWGCHKTHQINRTELSGSSTLERFHACSLSVQVSPLGTAEPHLPSGKACSHPSGEWEHLPGKLDKSYMILCGSFLGGDTPEGDAYITQRCSHLPRPWVSRNVFIRPAKSRPSVNCNSMLRLVFIEILQRLYGRIKKLLPRTLCLPAYSSTFSSSSFSIILCSIKKYSSVILILSSFPGCVISSIKHT